MNDTNQNNLGVLPSAPAGLIKNEKECVDNLFYKVVIPADKPAVRYVAVAEHPNGTIYSAVLPYTYPSDIPWCEMADNVSNTLESAFPQVSFCGSMFSIELVENPSSPTWIDHPNEPEQKENV